MSVMQSLDGRNRSTKTVTGHAEETWVVLLVLLVNCSVPVEIT